MRTATPLATASALFMLTVSLSACGSGTKTVSVPGAPTNAKPPQAATGPAKSTPTRTSASGGGTTTGSSTRTAPEPAFTEGGRQSEGSSAATAVLRARGFTPANTADYHPHQALEVLIGRRTAAGDGYGQQAFFFVNGRYIGTDASAPSAALSVVSQSDTEVTLAYPLYRKSDPLCCPGGGHARVRFQLNNGKLTALDPIPPLERKAGLSRY